jgi:preprotein translocase subunit SecG
MNLEVLKILELILSVAIVLLVLIQTKSNTFSQSLTARFSFNRTKRGLEKIVFYLTIILIALFTVNSLIIVYLSK